MGILEFASSSDQTISCGASNIVHQEVEALQENSYIIKDGEVLMRSIRNQCSLYSLRNENCYI